MASHSDSSNLNQEVINDSEILLSSSDSLSNFGHDKIDKSRNANENIGVYVNGVNEDESRSCERDYSNNSFQECDSSLCGEEHSNKSSSARLNVKSVSQKIENCFSNQKDFSKNENKLCEEINSGSNKSLVVNRTENHCSENNLCESETNTLEYQSVINKDNPIEKELFDSGSKTGSNIECENRPDTLIGDRPVKNTQENEDICNEVDGSKLDVDKTGRGGEVLEENSCHEPENLGSEPSHHDSLSQDFPSPNQHSVESHKNNNLFNHSDKSLDGMAKEQNEGDVDEMMNEEEEVNLQENSLVPKIHLVTTLGNFIDEGTTTGSPAQNIDSPAANPLETDHEDTNDQDDSVTRSGDDDLISVEDNSNTVSDTTNEVCPVSSGPERDKNDSENLPIKDASKNLDSCDQEEVITGDKTVSEDYVSKNLEILGEGSPVALNDHGYSKQGTPPPADGKENRVKKSPKTLKVIYPKKKVVDVNQLDIHIMPVPVLKTCLHCAKLAKCCIRIEVGGCECHLCSEECLERHKTLQSKTLRRTCFPVEDVKDNMTSGARICVQCSADVSVQPEEKILSWETMEFCNEDCLGKYQSKMWTSCAGCSKEVPTSSIGKYCVRFGHEIKQFCCSSCLEDFKKGIKACSYCQKDLSSGEEGFLAPIADKNQFRDFCSQNCLDEYDCMSRNLPAGGLKVEACGVCDKTQLVQVQVITASNTVNLCSEVCFKAFKFVNTSISNSPCCMCKKYFENNSSNKVTVYYENEILSFCSKTCLYINILAKRRIVACNWCKVKKYNFDMIRRKTANSIVTNWCSLNCMALYQVSMNAKSLRNKSNCVHCYKYGYPSLHLTAPDGSIRNFCSLDCFNKFKGNNTSQNGNSAFSTGTPKRVLRTKGLIQAEKSTFSDITPKELSGGLVKTGSINLQSLGSPVIHNKPDEVPSPSNVHMVASSTTNVLTLQAINPDVKNAKVQVYCHKADKTVFAKPTQATKSLQTDEIKEKGPVLVPVPVPIYVPVPMAMYSVPVPTPFPFPIPIPVPLIIPTSKEKAGEILEDIKRIQEKIPGNPFEAELLMMAEMAEGEKKSTDSEGTRPADGVKNDETKLRQKRSSEEVEDEEGPPGKKRREENSNDILDSTIHHLATSHLSMSLKETLGVSAWKHYASQNGESLDMLEMRSSELSQALKRFILNARIPGEGEYTPDQKYYLMLGIQYYLEESGRIDNIFFDKIFDPFIDALNDEAKKFQEIFAHSGNVITRVEEEHLWESKQLGPFTPATLLATLIYFNTKYFNLSTVEEHMQLSFTHIMKHWKRNPNTAQSSSNSSKSAQSSRNVLLRFYPPQSSLEGPNAKKKTVYEQEANEADPYRCPVQLYEFYLSKCPESMKSRNDMFYLSPERSCVPDSPIWYSTLPLDTEVLDRILNRFKMVKEINLALLSDV